jgi:ketosteroid isomerase-like protein
MSAEALFVGVEEMRTVFCRLVVLAGLMCAGSAAAYGQLQFPSAGSASQAPNPLTDTTVKPGKMVLFDLEARFAKDVAAHGGAGFAKWFAPDGVLLGNGAAPVMGQVAIAMSATWLPQNYQLTWTPIDAVMGPSGDIGYTWSHYEGHSKDAAGNPVVTSGRFITIWRKEPDGSWKVALDAGANEPPEAGDCCRLPSPGQSPTPPPEH